MTIKYFQDTDTLHIEFRAAEVAETRDLDENTQLDIERDGNICAMTIEHAGIGRIFPISPSSRLQPNRGKTYHPPARRFRGTDERC